MKVSREKRQRLKTENRRQPKALSEVKRDLWPTDVSKNKNRMKVWRSKDYLVQLFNEDNNFRLSINRSEMLPNGRWKDNLTWDELQEIKTQVGYGDWCAVEIYPKNKDVVNVANMRHLWLLNPPLVFGWEK